MEARYVVIKDKKGVKWVYGIYRPEGMQYGPNGIRKCLGLLEDISTKETKAVRRSRSETESWYLDDGTGRQHFKTKEAITKGLVAILKANGLYIPEIKPWHGFRARVISLMIEGKGVVHAKQMVGHQNVSTTESYLDTEILDMDEAVDLLRIHSKFTVPENKN